MQDGWIAFDTKKKTIYIQPVINIATSVVPLRISLNMYILRDDDAATDAPGSFA